MMRVVLKKSILIGILTGFMIAVTFPYTAYAGEVLKIGGVGSALGTMKLLGNAFEKKNPGVEVDVLPSLGSSGAVKALSKDAIDIGLIGRPMKDEEKILGLSVTEYAKTPFIFVTKKEINISNITHDEIVKIFNGEALKWPDGERIRLVLRPAGDSDTLIVKKISPEISAAMDIALSRQGMIMALTDQENADMTEKTAGSFGSSTLTQIISEKRHLNILNYNGVVPSVKTLSNGKYPLFKPIFIITKPEPSKLVRKFLDFIRSSEGKRILEESGNLVVDRP